MELRHLRYFVAVADELSFTKAAQKLRFSQPSLTRQVRNLEEELGVRLLDRSRNQIVLTDEGRVFFSDAQKLLAACAESVSAVQRMGSGERSQLNIGYVASVYHSLLPATLGAFRKLSPLVALNLFDLTPAEQALALDERRIDLGFVGLRPKRAGLDLRSECIAHDPVVAALAQHHPLAKKSKVKLTDLSTQFFICMSARTDPGNCEWVSSTCKSAGFTAKVLQEALDGPSAIRFVRDGLGVTLTIEQTAAVPHEGVVFRPLSPAAPSRIVHRLAGRQSLETPPGLRPDRHRALARQVSRSAKDGIDRPAPPASLPAPLASAGGHPVGAAIGVRGFTTQNKWFLVGPAAAGLKSPEASGGDDTEEKDEGGMRKDEEAARVRLLLTPDF